MERMIEDNEAAIVLFVTVPACIACRERIEDLMKEMQCWKKIEIGYPSKYGSKIWLYYDKEDKDTDYWEKGKKAKEILELYHYRVM